MRVEQSKDTAEGAVSSGGQRTAALRGSNARDGGTIHGRQAPPVSERSRGLSTRALHDAATCTSRTSGASRRMRVGAIAWVAILPRQVPHRRFIVASSSSSIRRRTPSSTKPMGRVGCGLLCCAVSIPSANGQRGATSCPACSDRPDSRDCCSTIAPRVSAGSTTARVTATSRRCANTRDGGGAGRTSLRGASLPLLRTAACSSTVRRRTTGEIWETDGGGLKGTAPYQTLPDLFERPYTHRTGRRLPLDAGVHRLSAHAYRSVLLRREQRYGDMYRCGIDDAGHSAIVLGRHRAMISAKPRGERRRGQLRGPGQYRRRVLRRI